MKIFIITLLIGIIFGLFFGLGYFLYQKYYLNNLGGVKTSPTNNKSYISPKTFTSSINSTTKKQLNIGQDYLAHYQNSINYLNQISNSFKNLQQILVEIEKNYNDKNYLALLPLVSKAGDENLSFTKIVLELENSFNNWSTTNRNTTNEIIKSKTNQVIEAGFNYTQSLFNFSKAADGILAYKGIGDLNQLSEKLQETAQKMATDGKKLNELFNELNNILNL